MTGPWPESAFADVVESRGAGAFGLPQSEWSTEGKYPVIGQGAEFVEGWTDRDDLVVRPTPALVLYGGHTRRAKFVDRPFVLGPNVKVLEPKAALDARFLFRFLEQLHIESRGYADHFPEVRRHKVPLPPIPEQRRIAAILDAAGALLTKRRAAIARLDELTQSIFLDMFGDPQANQKGFPIKSLSEFYVNDSEGTKCGPFGSALKKGEFVSDGVPVWNMDNIDARGRMALPCRMWITPRKFKQLAAYAVRDGDVIISRAGTVGKMCVIAAGVPESIISTNLIRVRFGSALLPSYFVSLMTYCKGRVGRLKTGPDGAFTHMSTHILDTLKFPYPPPSLQKRFAETAQSIEAQTHTLGSQAAEMENLFAALQQRAFRGEL